MTGVKTRQRKWGKREWLTTGAIVAFFSVLAILVNSYANEPIVNTRKHWDLPESKRSRHAAKFISLYQFEEISPNECNYVLKQSIEILEFPSYPNIDGNGTIAFEVREDADTAYILMASCSELLGGISIRRLRLW